MTDQDRVQEALDNTDPNNFNPSADIYQDCCVLAEEVLRLRNVEHVCPKCFKAFTAWKHLQETVE